MGNRQNRSSQEEVPQEENQNPQILEPQMDNIRDRQLLNSIYNNNIALIRDNSNEVNFL